MSVLMTADVWLLGSWWLADSDKAGMSLQSALTAVGGTTALLAQVREVLVAIPAPV
jgi:hypothetical protein